PTSSPSVFRNQSTRQHAGLKERVDVADREHLIAMVRRKIATCSVPNSAQMRVLRYLTDELKVSEEDKKRWYAHWIQQGLSAVEQLLRKSQSGRFCVGDAPGLADCCLIPQWANALRMGCDLSGYPRCKAVYDACVQLPAFIAAAPENQQDKIPA
ncbi:glutathione-S-transferase family protein, partial [Salmonella enterica subsp. enterica serovar Enteritidis str. SE30663]